MEYDYQHYFSRYEIATGRILSPQQKGRLKKLTEKEFEYCIIILERKMNSMRPLTGNYFNYMMGILKNYRYYCPQVFNDDNCENNDVELMEHV